MWAGEIPTTTTTAEQEIPTVDASIRRFPPRCLVPTCSDDATYVVQRPNGYWTVTCDRHMTDWPFYLAAELNALVPLSAASPEMDISDWWKLDRIVQLAQELLFP